MTDQFRFKEFCNSHRILGIRSSENASMCLSIPGKTPRAVIELTSIGLKGRSVVKPNTQY